MSKSKLEQKNRLALPVTIGVTTYNAEETVSKALESVFSQTVTVQQILVVDDCSTDSTMSILQELANVEDIEIYQNPKNSGVATSRNEIIKRAIGDFIVFFDDDDVSLPNRVEAQIDRIIDYEARFGNGAPVICHTARLQVYTGKTMLLESSMGERTNVVAPNGIAVAYRALMGTPLENAYGSCATCSQAGRTDMYRELGGFDEYFRRCEDSDFAIRFALHGGHFVGIAEPLVTQTMTATDEKNLSTVRHFNLRLLEKHKDIFHSAKVFDFCMCWLELKYDWLEGHRFMFLLRFAKLVFQAPLLVFQRCKMALPNVRNNRVFSQFFKKTR